MIDKDGSTPPVNDSRCTGGGGHLARICAEDAVHVCPDDNIGAAREGAHDGGAVVAAVAL